VELAAERPGMHKRDKTRKRMSSSNAKRVFRVIKFAVLLTLLAGAALSLGKFAAIIQSSGISPATWIDTMRNPRGHFPADKNRVNILLIGKDYSYARSKTDPTLNGARYSKDSRSDTIMLLSLDLKRRRVSVLSIPRDTRVTAPDGETGKINATYRRGGVPLLAATVGDLLGVSPDYYIAIKPDAVKHVVDQLGGVEVETIDAMEYHDAQAGLHIDLPKGRQIINGDQAVGFARFREADMYARNPDGTPIYTGRKDRAGNPIFVRRRQVRHSEEEGDIRRTARQQQLLRAMAARAKQPQNWLQADKVINTALSQVETDLSHPQLLAIAALFRNVQPDQIQTATLEGRGTTHGTYYIDLDPRKTEAMVAWLLKGDESAANRLTVVEVKNGTKIPGFARQVTEALRNQGFDAKNAGNSVVARRQNAPEAGQTTIYYGTAAVAPRAHKIVEVLGGGTLSKLPPERVRELGAADVSVLLGRDIAPGFAASQQQEASLR